MDYLDFELEIGTGHNGLYPLAVLRSPMGEPRATLRLPFDERELQLRLLALENALLRSGLQAAVRKSAPPDVLAIQAFGQSLFDALLTDEVRTCYKASLLAAREREMGLRLKLRVRDPLLAGLPWELLYDPGQGEYVCLSRATPLVRYLPPALDQPIGRLAVNPPLRILGLVASPHDLPALDVPAEKQRIEAALDPLHRSGLVEIHWLPTQTWDGLQQAMFSGTWHIFHFIGHGSFDEAQDEGMLALAGAGGHRQVLTATQVGRLLAGYPSLRLVLLNACDSARGGSVDLFSSTAATLVQRGIPAVLAMQYEIRDEAAIQLVGTFYDAIAHGVPVDLAVTEARIALSAGAPNTIEWATPVLYMRPPDGYIFDLPGATRETSRASRAQPARPAPLGRLVATPAGRIWQSLLLLAAGWAAIYFVFALIGSIYDAHGNLLGQGPGGASPGLLTRLIFVRLASGSALGLSLALVLRRLEPSIGAVQIGWLAIGWAAAGVFMPGLIGLALGGAVVGLVLRQLDPVIRGWQVALIALGWAVGGLLIAATGDSITVPVVYAIEDLVVQPVAMAMDLGRPTALLWTIHYSIQVAYEALIGGGLLLWGLKLIRPLPAQSS